MTFGRSLIPSLALSLALLFSLLHAQEEFRYQSDWESIRSRYQCPEWFRDAKFEQLVPGKSTAKARQNLPKEKPSSKTNTTRSATTCSLSPLTFALPYGMKCSMQVFICSLDSPVRDATGRLAPYR